MGTWRALANPFSPCLSRKRQSWGACDSLFPLPVEEKDCRGTLQGSVAGVRTELRRALKGSAGLCKASWLGIAFPSTGRGKWASQARSGVSSISRLREAPFPRQAEGKGFKPPRMKPPPLAVGVLSMSRPREAFFPRRAKGKRTFSPGSACEASVGKQSFPKHWGSKHAQPKGRRMS